MPAFDPLYINQLIDNPRFIRDHLSRIWDSTQPEIIDAEVLHELETLRHNVIQQTEVDYTMMLTEPFLWIPPVASNDEINQMLQQNIDLNMTKTPSQSLHTLAPAYPSYFADSDFFSSFFSDPNKAVYLNLLHLHARDYGTFFIYGTPLTVMIANTRNQEVFALIRAGVDINKYSPEYGNTPLLLAITKGWNHQNTDGGSSDRQREIIETLLGHDDLNINARHLKNGMTALHIACARGDDPLLVHRLIAKGAQLDSRDLQGKIPLDYLDLSYEEAQHLISNMTDHCAFHHNGHEHQSDVATLPTREERSRHIERLRTMLLSNLTGRHGFWNRETVDPSASFQALSHN